MRVWIASLAALAAACSGEVTVEGDAPPGESYTLEVRATEGEQTYLVIAPDGRVVGARAAEGASALMNADRARELAGDPPPQGETPPEVMSLRFPGIDMQINADEGEGETGRANVSINAGEHSVVVNADEGGPGEADDRAYVRITGADQDAVRDFIDDAEELSPQVKTEMLAELGIAATAPEDEAQP
ncbi:MAG TPA: hypothetical protein VEF55_11730 [Candidatus Binatia bacterium]|nr:hypothetical protein [Candidatus Binatia bacterium]